MRAAEIRSLVDVILAAEAAVPRMQGGCFAWAIAIRRVLLPKSKIVLCVNKAVFLAVDSRLVGHAAVCLGDVENDRSVWLDSEGRTNLENVESWGMLGNEREEWEAYGSPGRFKDWARGGHEEVYRLVFDDEGDCLEYLAPEVCAQANKVERALRGACALCGFRAKY